MARIWVRSAARNAVRAAVDFGSPDQRLVALQRKLRVDDERAGRIRHVDQAIGPPAVGQRRLPGEGVGRQGLGDDVVELDLPEGAPGLLVRQDVLQAQHVARQRLDLGLRPIDGREPLLQLPERTGRAGRAVAERGADLRLRPPLRLGELGQPAGQPRLRVAHVAQPSAERQEEDHEDQQRRAAGERGQRERVGEVERHVRPNSRSISASFSST